MGFNAYHRAASTCCRQDSSVASRALTPTKDAEGQFSKDVEIAKNVEIIVDKCIDFTKRIPSTVLDESSTLVQARAIRSSCFRRDRFASKRISASD